MRTEKQKALRRAYRARPDVKAKAKIARQIYLSKPEAREKSREHDRKRYRASDKRRLQKAKSTEKIRSTPEGKIRRSVLESKQYARKNGHISVDPDTVKPPHEDGLCDLCGKPPGKRRLSLDHCHDTGRFRGWICDPCNVSLARLGDNVEGLIRAINYINFGRPVGAGGVKMIGGR